MTKSVKNFIFLHINFFLKILFKKYRVNEKQCISLEELKMWHCCQKDERRSCVDQLNNLIKCAKIMSKQILTKPQYDVKTFISFLQEMILVGREVGDASTLQIHAICTYLVCVQVPSTGSVVYPVSEIHVF